MTSHQNQEDLKGLKVLQDQKNPRTGKTLSARRRSSERALAKIGGSS